MKRSAFLSLWAFALGALTARAAHAAFVKPRPSGKWKIDVRSGRSLGTGYMFLTQSGAAVVGRFDKIAIRGTMVTANKVSASWSCLKGAGWLSIWLNGDLKSFHGAWGWHGGPAAGRFAGYRVEGK